MYSRPLLKDVSGQIRNIDISPNGERILLTARGDLFSVPAKKGITYNLTNSSDANDFAGTWSPDGQKIAYISDKNGEFNIWIRDVFTGKEQDLTQNLKTYIFNILWSPDSKKIAWNDKQNNLNITDVATGKTETVETSGIGTFYSYNWSPDSKYLTYVRPEKNTNNLILYNLDTKEKHQITDGWYEINSPNFSSDGKYLVFSSARTFNPTYSQTEWNHVYTNMNKIYILPLTEEAPIPFAPENDNLKSAPIEKTVKPENTSKKSKTKQITSTEKAVVYNFENLNNRVIELPVPASY